MAGGAVGVAAALSLLLAVPGTASAASYPSDSNSPDLIPILGGYDKFWTPSGKGDLHGTVKNKSVLQWDDKLTVWINNNATKNQQFKAMQDSEYDDDGKAYDQSVTISDSLGSVLGPLYVTGRNSGKLPLVSRLINSQDGTTGAYVDTGDAKKRFSHPRPFLPTDPKAKPVKGDDAGCAPSKVNGSSVRATRVGQSYADSTGALKIKRLPDVTDTTHKFSANDVPLSAEYGGEGICTGGSFPSGHTTTAYQAGITLATLLPELAPQILARSSEAGNDRIVLGVHYPLDIIGGRMDGEVALAIRWSDSQFVSKVLQPARKELVSYLQKQCGGTIASCISKQKAYQDSPYGGAAIPGGTAQVVTDRASATKVYRERLTYGFPQVGASGLAASVPSGAENLLLTAYPKLTAAQRKSVLAQTEIASGYPLDGSQTSSGSWQRLDLAAALSATVQRNKDGSVTVLKTGGPAQVVDPSGQAPTSTATSGPPVVTDGPVGHGSNNEVVLAGAGAIAAGVIAVGSGVLARRRRHP